ncbi:DNA-formamidopyrimidine glycosylase family protein, partial [Isoptericola sp. NPDC057391]|uniref:DNA-formamidopyrimidine glycosylase family protein n=1 Tax=Isoptericola sp. NPDC057391 TaxID=3346117 RepID=UPI003626A3A6
MPEGHTVHRLARALDGLFGGEALAVSSPQGRFAGGAALLDGRRLVTAEAWGKQLFCAFAPDRAGRGPAKASREPDTPDDARWLRVHLGLYGAWTFAGDGSADVVHAIGAPRRRIGERETTPDDGGPGAAAAAGAAGEWVPPA